MIWLITLISIFLLPFFSPVLIQTGVLYLYGALLICLLFTILRSGTYFKKSHSCAMPLICFLSIAIITSFFAVSLRVAFYGTFYLILCAVIFASLAGLSLKKKKQIGLVFIGATFFISVIALLQRFFYFDKVIPYMISQKPFMDSTEFFYLMDIIKMKRVISIFTTPNLLASYLVMINLLTLGYIYSYERKRYIILFTCSFIINSYCLWLTGSFMGIVSFIIGFLLFAIMLFIKNREKFMRLLPILALLALGALIMLTALISQRCAGMLYRYNLSFSLAERMRLWRFTSGIISDRLWSFSGPGNFANICRTYITANTPNSTMAHNLFMQLWIELGFYGLATFVWFLIVLMRDGFKNIFNKSTSLPSSILRIGAFSAIVAFLLQNMGGFSFFVPQIAIIWWILCAFLIDNE